MTSATFLLPKLCRLILNAVLLAPLSETSLTPLACASAPTSETVFILPSADILSASSAIFFFLCLSLFDEFFRGVGEFVCRAWFNRQRKLSSNGQLHTIIQPVSTWCITNISWP